MKPAAEAHRLIESFLAGHWSPEDRLRWLALIDKHPELEHELVDPVLLVAMGDFRASHGGSEKNAWAPKQEVFQKIISRMPTSTKTLGKSNKLWRPLVISGALAATVLAAVLLIPEEQAGRTEPGPSSKGEPTIGELVLEFVVTDRVDRERPPVRGRPDMRVSEDSGLVIRYTNQQRGFMSLVIAGTEQASPEILYPPAPISIEGLRPIEAGTHDLVWEDQPVAIDLTGLEGRQSLVGILTRSAISADQAQAICERWLANPLDLPAEILEIGKIDIIVESPDQKSSQGE